MRIWDVTPRCLCRQHLLGEHRELHALWSIIQNHKTGYQSHPETKRWVGKLAALHKRHDDLVNEMLRRGYTHSSPLPKPPKDISVQTDFLQSEEEQYQILRTKNCPCPLDS
ncbi:MAG TPA: pyrimidine dimer DNA glycosylase/endonuclease V [Patescibacteria group bacterium]